MPGALRQTPDGRMALVVALYSASAASLPWCRRAFYLLMACHMPASAAVEAAVVRGAALDADVRVALVAGAAAQALHEKKGAQLDNGLSQVVSSDVLPWCVALSCVCVSITRRLHRCVCVLHSQCCASARQLCATGRLLRRMGLERALCASPAVSAALLAVIAASPTAAVVGLGEALRKVSSARAWLEIVCVGACSSQPYVVPIGLETDNELSTWHAGCPKCCRNCSAT